MHSKKGNQMVKMQHDRSVSKQSTGEIMICKLNQGLEAGTLISTCMSVLGLGNAAETERWHAGGHRSATVKRSFKKSTSTKCR